MKKGNFLKSGAAFLFGMLAALTAGCMTSFAAYDTASLSACTVEGGNSIVVTGTASAGTLAEGETADDGYYYLFELHPYETGIGSRTDYVAWSEKGDKLSFTVPYSGDPSDSRLYSRFVAAVNVGGTYQAISGPIYVTNPGDVAAFTEEFPEAQSKKGLLIELDMLGDAMN